MTVVARSQLLAVALVGLIAMVPPDAFAQPPRVPAHVERPLMESLQGPAKEAYVSGNQLYGRGDFAGASTKYGQAYELSKDPRLIYNMAACDKELHAYARMQAHLQRYVQEEGASIPAQDKADVDVALAALKNLVGTVSVSVDMPGTTVTLDGEPVGTTPLPAPLAMDLGKHTLGFKKDGFEAAERRIEIVGGTTTQVNVVLVRQETAAQLVVAAEPQATVTIDGQVVAKERFDGRVSAGAHEIQVSAPGKLAYKAEVDLHERETRTLQVTLKNAGGPAWPWIVSGVAVAIGAGIGGYLLFKPADHVGPSPTGDWGSVHLAAWGR